MKKAVLQINIIITIISFLLVINAFGLPVNIPNNCSLKSLMMVISFHYLPIILILSILFSILYISVWKKGLKRILFMFILVIFLLQVVYILLRVSVSLDTINCPEFMQTNYDGTI